ncbi:MAG: elongation factor G [Rhodothermales bacterium]|nr:elongation factor G [Rhodothermales bacterium]
MKVYDAQHIRNIALVGHQGAGKTSLAEAMLFVSGGIARMGTVESGSTVSDYHPSEQERQMSVFTSMLHAEWEGHKINILDTPGYPDFVGEVIASLRVADTALFLINAGEGVEVGTELGWMAGEDFNIPAMFVVNHLDKPDTRFDDVVSQIQERFGRNATIVQLPAGSGSRAIIDVLVMKQLSFPEGSDRATVSEIDPEFKERAEALHNELIENIAENDETLMELYFEKGSLTEDEMRKGLHEAMLRRQLFPIFLTSATENIGVARLMSFIDNVCPSAAEAPPVRLADGNTLKSDPKADPVVFIYRTMSEHHVGDYSFFKVSTGTIEAGLDLRNAQTDASERLGQIFSISGRNRESVDKMVAGDLGALVKLKNSHTNNTLHLKGSDVVVKPIEFPSPRYKSAVRAVREGDEDKLGQGLHQLAEEDPALVITHDAHLNQLVVGGLGEMQLEIARFRLKNRFGVEVEYIKPKLAYLETIQGSATSKYRHKKQTGGAGQFAEIAVILEPLNGEYQPPREIKVRNTALVETPWGSKIEFIDAIVGGVIDMRRFFGAIQKGVLEAMQEGPIAGYPVGNLRMIIFDGGMHSVDSNENAFKSAARAVFRDSFKEARPVLLEPIYDVEIVVPDTYTGEVMGDLNTRRGRIQGIDAEGVFQKVVAQVPEAELHRYSTTLRSLTHGRGLHRATFSHYEPMPRNVQEKVVQEAGQLQEA